jgi:hypothetical protein
MKIKKIPEDFLIGIVLLSICFFLYVVIIPREVQGEIQRGMPPDFFPKFSVAWIGLFAIFLMVKSLFSRAKELPSEKALKQIKEGRKGVIFAIIGTIFYLVLCSLISYIPATLVTLLLFMRVFGERRWIMLITVPAVIVLAIYVIFAKIMIVQLPQSIFFD